MLLLFVSEGHIFTENVFSWFDMALFRWGITL